LATRKRVEQWKLADISEQRRRAPEPNLAAVNSTAVRTTPC